MIPRREFLLGAIASATLAAQARADLAPDDEVRDILRERIDRAHQSLGIVAARFDPTREKLLTYGHSGAAADRALDGDTVFEIGSITKVFTSVLLTEMVTRGEVALDDPLSKYLPDTVKMPARNGKQITFLDLATYTSGLPRIPTGVPAYGDNPYAAIRSSNSMNFSPITRCGTTPVLTTNIPTSASACSGMCSRSERARATRTCWYRASANR
jgi:D-alanyl-D-alanine-carboxypeptidase/D-alanyl-D-alanine-endopeptidase